MSNFFGITFTLFAVFFVFSQGFTARLQELSGNLLVGEEEIVSIPEEEINYDYEKEICPEKPKDICYFSTYGEFTGKVECDKPIMCGETPVEIPDGTECEYDAEHPDIATKVCIEGKCVAFIRARGDC